MIVVADTSPLNYLVLIGHVEILPYFYQRVLVPSFVWQELQDVNTPESQVGPKRNSFGGNSTEAIRMACRGN